MAAKKYPLDPLVKLREQHVEEATRELGAAVRAREVAEHRTRAAKDEERRAEERAKTVRQGEQAKLEAGQLTVADLQRADAWAFAAAEEKRVLEAQVQRAAEAEAEARSGETRQRDVVASRKADAEVVEKDKAKWTERTRKDALAKEEEEATEAWRPKSG